MPRMQVYLPDDLYQQVKSHCLPASALLQDAVRRELERREIESETDRYLAELEAEIGPPSEADFEWARSLVDSMKVPSRAKRAS